MSLVDDIKFRDKGFRDKDLNNPNKIQINEKPVGKFQAQHLIPASVGEDSDLLRYLRLSGVFSVDKINDNGIWLPEFR